MERGGVNGVVWAMLLRAERYAGSFPEFNIFEHMMIKKLPKSFLDSTVQQLEIELKTVAGGEASALTAEEKKKQRQQSLSQTTTELYCRRCISLRSSIFWYLSEKSA